MFALRQALLKAPRPTARSLSPLSLSSSSSLLGKRGTHTRPSLFPSFFKLRTKQDSPPRAHRSRPSPSSVAARAAMPTRCSRLGRRTRRLCTARGTPTLSCSTQAFRTRPVCFLPLFFFFLNEYNGQPSTRHPHSAALVARTCPLQVPPLVPALALTPARKRSRTTSRSSTSSARTRSAVTTSPTSTRSSSDARICCLRPRQNLTSRPTALPRPVTDSFSSCRPFSYRARIADLDRKFLLGSQQVAGLLAVDHPMTLREIMGRLKEIYCQTIGAEYMVQTTKKYIYTFF